MTEFYYCPIVSVPLSYQNRKYDINAECLKLYKEDLSTVLMRFRRSPEYVKILEDRNKVFDDYVEDVKTHISFFYYDAMQKKIADIIGYQIVKEVDESNNENGPTPSYRLLRSNKDDKAANISVVERLDSYPKLSSTMTLSQRNAMKELGFQFAGHVIHALIKNMGQDKSEQSTVLSDDGGTTTEHVSIHSVSPEEEEKEETVTESEAVRAGHRTQPKKRFQTKWTSFSLFA